MTRREYIIHLKHRLFDDWSPTKIWNPIPPPGADAIHPDSTLGN